VLKDIGPMELVIVLVIVLLIFGAGKLPSIGGALGKSIREFKKAKDGDEDKMAGKPTEAVVEKPVKQIADRPAAVAVVEAPQTELKDKVKV
jgi:sec-independent protein translocase protein TatA